MALKGTGPKKSNEWTKLLTRRGIKIKTKDVNKRKNIVVKEDKNV